MPLTIVRANRDIIFTPPVPPPPATRQTVFHDDFSGEGSNVDLNNHLPTIRGDHWNEIHQTDGFVPLQVKGSSEWVNTASNLNRTSDGYAAIAEVDGSPGDYPDANYKITAELEWNGAAAAVDGAANFYLRYEDNSNYLNLAIFPPTFSATNLRFYSVIGGTQTELVTADYDWLGASPGLQTLEIFCLSTDFASPADKSPTENEIIVRVEGTQLMSFTTSAQSDVIGRCGYGAGSQPNGTFTNDLRQEWRLHAFLVETMLAPGLD